MINNSASNKVNKICFVLHPFVPYSEGFPSFSIYTPTSGSLIHPEGLQGVYNDKEYFDFYFVGVDGEIIEAISC